MKDKTDSRLPWCVVRSVEGPWQVWTCPNLTPGSQNNYMIADQIQTEQEAHLIAAAPDLLASCERLMAVLAPFTALCVQNAGDIETTRAVVAKAGGEA